MSLIILEKDDFLKGTYKDVHVNHGILMLEEDKLNGCYETQSMEADKFKKVIASWNGRTTESTYISIQISFYKDGKWSMWFSYGKWSDNGQNKGSVTNQTDDLGKMNVDIISVNNGAGEKIKVRVFLERKDVTVESPALRRIVVSTFYEYNELDMDLKDIDIEVPLISQMMVPEIGKSICSPTSLNMIMSNYGHVEDTFSVAQSCFDNGAGIYGNWAYNIAYSGECNFNSYVMFCENSSIISDYIASGTPLVVSIKTNEITQLKGAPQTYPSGHLIVIRGFANKDESYIIVNDPASREIDNVKRYYQLSEFLKVWNKIVYIIKPESS